MIALLITRVYDWERERREGFMEALIRAEKICKDYEAGEVKVQALKHVSFEIQRGEFIVILGPAGLGKAPF